MKNFIIILTIALTLTACNKSGTSTVGKNFLGDIPEITPIVLEDKEFTVQEDSSLTNSVKDILDTVTYSLKSTTSHGTLVIDENGDFTYTPALNYSGVDSFSYEVLLQGKKYQKTAKINVVADNDAPVLSTLITQFVTQEETTLMNSLSASDVDSLVLNYELVQSTSNGTLTLSPLGSFIYTPNVNFHGVDVFRVRVSDGQLNSPVVAYSILVTPVNDAPIATPFAFAVDAGQTHNGQLIGSDVDGDSLTYVLVSSPSKGSVTVNPLTGAFSYSANLGTTGTDSFSYQVNDGSLDSSVVTVVANINAVNVAPQTINYSESVLEEQVLSSQVVGSDINGDTLSYSVISSPSHGTLVLNSNGTYTYTPVTNYNGPDSFSYKANDGMLDSSVSTVSITVLPVDDAPIAYDSSFSTGEDVSHSGVVSGYDIETAVLTYSLVSGPTHGTVTFNSNGTYTYTPASNYNGSDSFSFLANDGALNSNVATVSINVNSSNDTPIANPESLTTAEDTALLGMLTATDSDGDTLSYSVVSSPTHGTVLVNSSTGAFTYTPSLNYNGSDSFTFVANDGSANSTLQTISITVTPVNDLPTTTDQIFNVTEDTPSVITISNASDVDGDVLTRIIVTPPTKGTLTVIDATLGTFTYTPNANETGVDSFTFKVNDGTADSNVSTATININNQNDLPVANASSFTTLEDTVYNGSLSATDSDGDLLVYSLVGSATKGIVLMNFDGSFSYTPSLNANGSDSFTFKVNDGTGDSNTATVSITITPVNDAPIASNSTVAVTEDTAQSFTLNASDVDGDVLSYTIVSSPTKGTISGTGSNLIYTPNTNATGSDTLTFKVNDGTVDSNTATVTFNIGNTNDLPIANNSSFTTLEDTVYNGSVTATDADGDTLTYSVVSAPTKGSVVMSSNGSFTYTPSLNANGSDSFTFKSNDGTVDSNTATVSVTITPINDAPVSSNSVVAVVEDTPQSFTLLATDVEGDVLSYTIISSPTKGTISGTGANRIYTPNANATGVDTLTFKVNDGSLDSNTSTVTFNISNSNDLPVANNSSFTTLEDTVYNGSVTATDADSDTLTYLVISAPTKGTAVMNSNGTFTYTPNLNANGSDSFTFRANDGTGNSNTATVSITITPVNDAPVATNGSSSVNEDSILNSGVVASDVDGDTLTYSVVSAPTNGTLTLNTNGTFTYTPNANYSGSDSFTYKANDGSLDSNVATRSITVSPLNDAPVANNSSFTILEDSGISSRSLTGSDVDGTPITYSLVTSPTKGVISGFNSSTGAYSYTPNLNANGADSFTFKVNDGTQDSTTATVSITITPVNDAPVWTTSTSITLNTTVNTPISTTLNATDVDGNPITYAMQACSGGTCSLNPTTGAFTFTPNNNYSGTVSFGATCTDGILFCSPNTFITINIIVPNTAPVANSSSTKLILRTGSAAVSLSASDAESNPLTYTIVSGPSSGTLSGTGSSRTYTLGSWTNCASEGQNCSFTGTRLVKYGTATNYLITKATDGIQCSNEVLSDPAVGGTKTCSILPVSDSFTFKVNDGTVDSNTATVTINYEDWFNQSWTKRKKLVFNAGEISSDLVDFPVLVRLDSTRIDYSQVQSQGQDLRFLDSSGVVLAHEIETWNPAGVSYVWVKTSIGAMEKNNHYVFMYYGNSTATDGQNKTGVWSNGYVGVWHMNQTTGQVLDSTSNLNHGTIGGTITRTNAGPLGNSYLNTSNNGCFTVPGNDSQKLNSQLSVEVLARRTSSNSDRVFLKKNIIVGGNTLPGYEFGDNSGKLTAKITDSEASASSGVFETNSSTVTNNSWDYFSMTYDGLMANSQKYGYIYKNGAQINSFLDTNESLPSWSANWQPMQVMGDCSSLGFRGAMDEIRLSNVMRSSDWIKYQYLSMVDGLIMYSNEEDVSSPNMLLSYVLTIKSNNDDGNNIRGISNWNRNGWNNAGVNWVGEENSADAWGYYRFQTDVKIPTTGVVNAKMKFLGRVESGGGQVWNNASHYLKIMGQASANAPQVSSGTQYPGSGISAVSNEVLWNSSYSLTWNWSDWNVSPNISSVVNQMSSSYSIDAGNYMQFWIKRGGNLSCGGSGWCEVGMVDYYANSVLGAKLLIEW